MSRQTLSRKRARAAGAPEDGSVRARVLLIRPNRSLTVRGMVWLLAAYAGLMTLIGVGFMHAGLWMVLPFAGLEAVVIIAIFYFLVYRHLDDHEAVILEGENLSIIKHEGRVRSYYELPRYWTRVDLEPGQHRGQPSRLLLQSQGRAVEIGAQVREEGRRALAGQVRRLLGRTAYS